MSTFDGARARVAGATGLNGGGVSSGQLAAAVADRAPKSATYLVKTADGNLPNAQALDAIGSLPGIALVNADGTVSKATGSDLPSHTHTGVVVERTYVIHGGGSTITTGVKLDMLFGAAMTVTDIYAMADQSGSIDIRHWLDDFASYPPDSGDNVYTFTINNDDSRHVSGLSLAISAGDVLRINVQSVTSFQRVSVTLVGTRTV